MTSPEEEAVLEANRVFYAAVEAGDIDALRRIWWDHPDTVCVHPGADPIHGTEGVLRSWSLIMANTPYIQFFLTDVRVSVAGDRAVVTLTENILVAGEGAANDTFQGGLARAINVFSLTPEGWRVWVHQAAPVLSGGS